MHQFIWRYVDNFIITNRNMYLIEHFDRLDTSFHLLLDDQDGKSNCNGPVNTTPKLSWLLSNMCSKTDHRTLINRTSSLYYDLNFYMYSNAGM